MWAVNQSVAHPTPSRLGITQSMSVDFSRPLKPLGGQGNIPYALAPGLMSIKGKISQGQINLRAYNDLFFGGTTAVGQTLIADNEAGTIPGTSTYTVTVANSATFVEDLGVVYNATGKPFTLVTSLTAVGQYTFAAGVYTFYSGDASALVNISYTYTNTTVGTQTDTIAVAAMGSTNVFQSVMNMPYGSNQANIILNNCVAEKVGLATKLEDWLKPDFEFQASLDATGTLGKIVVAIAG